MVRELTPTYAETVELSVVEGTFAETKQRWTAHVPKGSHGLIAFDAMGKVTAHVEGHQFRKPKIVETIEAALKR